MSLTRDTVTVTVTVCAKKHSMFRKKGPYFTKRVKTTRVSRQRFPKRREDGGRSATATTWRAEMAALDALAASLWVPMGGACDMASPEGDAPVLGRGHRQRRAVCKD